MNLQGPVPLEDPVYATRNFETDLVREIQAGKWVLLLGPRQHGKTSAFLRLRKTLLEHATTAALIDLQKSPPFESYQELVSWFSNQVASALDNAVEIDETKDLATALNQALPAGSAPVVILVDEASNIANDSWRNSFYGQLRAISSERATAKAGEIAKRLRFVFTGTFRPERLVAEANSPFNICERIDTTDLSNEDVVRLVADANLENAREIGQTIYDEVGGQPYLNQRLIYSALNSDDRIEGIKREIAKLREGDSEHIKNLFARVIRDDGLSSIVSEVVANGKVAHEAGNEDQRYLIVLGILRREKGWLYFRNNLYAQVACHSPNFSKSVPVEGNRVVIFPLESGAFSKVHSEELKEIAYCAQLGAVGAYKARSNRLALAGFGTAMEAVLIDFLKRQKPNDLAVAAAQCKQNKARWYDATDPSTWMLVDLMRGTRKLLGQGDVDIPENLREWRNLIHPGASIKNYKKDEDLTPEVCTAAGQLQIILRDLV